jgi:hypothetical protein
MKTTQDHHHHVYYAQPIAKHARISVNAYHVIIASTYIIINALHNVHLDITHILHDAYNVPLHYIVCHVRIRMNVYHVYLHIFSITDSVIHHVPLSLLTRTHSIEHVIIVQLIVLNVPGIIQMYNVQNV